MILQPLLDAVLVDIGGTLVHEAPLGTPVADLRVEPRAGVLDDLAAIAAQVRLGAVTNTATMTEAEVRSLLEPTGVDRLLEVVVTSVDVGQRKPDPLSLRTAASTASASTIPPGCSTSATCRPTPRPREAAGMAYVDVDGRHHPRRGRGAGWSSSPAGGSSRPGPRSDRRRQRGHGRGHRPPRPPDQAARARWAARGRQRQAGRDRRAPRRRRCPSPPPWPCSPATTACWRPGVSPWPQEVTGPDGGQLRGRRRRQSTCWPARPAPTWWWSTSAWPHPSRSSAPATPRRASGGSSPTAAVRSCTARWRRAPPTSPPGPAMTRTETLLALDVGVETAERAVADGARCLITGDMGIGNTTRLGRAHRRLHRHGRRPSVTGRGAGADDAVLARKVAVVEAAVGRLPATAGPLGPAGRGRRARDRRADRASSSAGRPPGSRSSSTA